MRIKSQYSGVTFTNKRMRDFLGFFLIYSQGMLQILTDQRIATTESRQKLGGMYFDSATCAFEMVHLPMITFPFLCVKIKK